MGGAAVLRPVGCAYGTESGLVENRLACAGQASSIGTVVAAAVLAAGAAIWMAQLMRQAG
jgi:hypothetical protein